MVRDEARKGPPSGSRTITGRINTEDGVVLCGQMVAAVGTLSFTEPPEQVVRDLAMGALRG